MDSTLKIALYGAIVASVGIILSIITALVQVFSYRRDRADIKVRVAGGMNVYPKTTVYGDKDYISINVVNKGRRPVMIMQCAVKMPIGAKPRWFTLAEALKQPRKLNEGEFTDYMLAEDQVHQYGLTAKDIVVFVLDPAGRYYWADNLLMRWWKLLYGATKFKQVKEVEKRKADRTA